MGTDYFSGINDKHNSKVLMNISVHALHILNLKLIYENQAKIHSLGTCCGVICVKVCLAVYAFI